MSLSHVSYPGTRVRTAPLASRLSMSHVGPATTWILFFVFSFVKIGLGDLASIQGPRFTYEPLHNVEFSNNSGVEIECSASGQPSPTVSWIHGDGTIAFDVLGLREVRENGTLVFLPFSADEYRQDVHAVVYRCVAANPAGTIISRDVHVKAVMFQHYEPHVYDAFAIKGNVGVLKCHLPASVRRHVVVQTWLRDEELQIDESVSADGKYVILPYGDLFITNVNESDSGSTYHCQTIHTISGDVKVSQSSGRLVVTDPQENLAPRILESVPDAAGITGENITIPCVAQGYPVPVVTWYIKNPSGQLVSLLPSDRIHHTGVTITIENLQLSDAGIYVCLAENEIANEKKEILLIVTEPITVNVEPKRVMVNANQPEELHCQITGFPIQSSFWMRNGKPLQYKNASRPLRVTDFGMYQCVAKNEIDMVQDSAQVVLGDIEPEILSAFEEKTLQSGTDVAFKCKATGNPLPKIVWKLDDTELHESSRFMTDIRIIDDKREVIGTLRIQKTLVEDGGVYKCIATNRVGTKEYSSRLNIFGRLGIHEVSKVTVVAGEDFAMACPYYGYPIENIVWKKGDAVLPSDIRQRVSENGTLYITKVEKTADSGKYSCAVSNKREEAIMRFQLIVSTAPKIIPFTFQDKYVSEGSQARALCGLQGGDVPVEFRWLKDGSLIFDNKWNITIKQIDNFSSILTISNVTKQHTANYTCYTKNNYGSSDYTTELIVNERPKWLTTPNDTSVLVGQNVILPCSAEGFPQPIISWFKIKGLNPRGELQEITSDSGYNMFSDGSLHINSVDYSHHGYYFCKIENKVGSLSKMVLLTVHSPPYFFNKLQRVIVRKGQKIILKCQAAGNKPIKFTWKVLEKSIPLTSGSRYRAKTSEDEELSISELTIDEAEILDSTSFTCVSENKFGRDEAEFHVLVMDVPNPPRNLKLIKTSNRSAIIGWTPSSDGNSKISKYIIQFKQSDETWESSARSETVPPAATKATLIGLRPSTEYDVRIYAENEIGRSESSNILEIAMEEEAPSEMPRNVNALATDAHTLKISWEPPQRDAWNGVIRGYYVGYKIAETSDPYTFKLLEVPENYTARLSLSLSDLQEYTKYSIVVQAFNDGGKGPVTEELIALTSESVPTRPPQAVRCSVLTSQSIHVTWQPPPAPFIHGILKGHKIIYRTMDSGHLRSKTKTVDEQTKITLQRLEKFANYTIQVLAFTGRGDGVKSEPIFCKTFEDIPGEPAAIKGLPASGDAVVLAWKPPEKTNGHIIKYTLYYRREDMDDVPKKYDVDGNLTLYEINGLKKSFRYEFWITASTIMGEGKKSRSIFQSPSEGKIPAKIASFDTVVVIQIDNDVKLSCKAVGKPKALHKWTRSGNPLRAGERYQFLPDGSLIIKDCQEEDQGNYTCTAANAYGNDKVSYTILVQTVPGVILVEIALVSTSYIDIQWKAESDGGSIILGYKLHYKHEQGDWEMIDFEPSVDSYRMDNLYCGTRYFIYMFAYNKIGQGEASPVVNASTKGGFPSPPPKKSLIEESSTSVALKLDNWAIDKCPIRHFIVEFKPLHSNKWRLFTEEVKPETKKLVIPELQPASWYSLRLIAHSTAGISSHEFTFATLTVSGETILLGPAADEAPRGPLFYLMDMKFILAAAIGIVVFVIISTIACVCTSGRSETKPKRKSNSDGMHIQRRSKGDIYVENNVFNCQRRDSDAGSRTPIRKDDLSPYATAQLSECRRSQDIRNYDCRTIPLAIGSSISGVGHPYYPQTVGRPLSDSFGTFTSPSTSNVINFRPHMQQLPTAPPPVADPYAQTQHSEYSKLTAIRHQQSNSENPYRRSNPKPVPPPVPPQSPVPHQVANNSQHPQQIVTPTVVNRTGMAETTFIYSTPRNSSSDYSSMYKRHSIIEGKYESPWDVQESQK